MDKHNDSDFEKNHNSKQKGFFSFVFEYNEDNKNKLMKIAQYVTLGFIFYSIFIFFINNYFPKIDDPNLSKFLERSLFDLVYKILYPKEYSEYYKFEEYDNKEQVLKDVLLLCIKHSNDETYDNLLTSLKQYLL